MLVRRIERQSAGAPRPQVHVGAEKIRVVGGWRRYSLQRAGEHADERVRRFEQRNLRHLHEARRHVTLRIEERDPELDAVETPTVVPRRLFSVCDPGTRRHDVDAVGPEHRFVAQAVVVNHFAVEEPRHRLQTDVRVRGHVHRLPLAERQGSEAIEKTPRPDHPPIPDRKCPRNRQ